MPVERLVSILAVLCGLPFATWFCFIFIATYDYENTVALLLRAVDISVVISLVATCVASPWILKKTQNTITWLLNVLKINLVFLPLWVIAHMFGALEAKAIITLALYFTFINGFFFICHRVSRMFSAARGGQTLVLECGQALAVMASIYSPYIAWI